jgi:RecA/RadA recombinase
MTSKPFDLSKFRTSVTKSITGISSGFHDPKDWISTGNHTLNYLISGNFHRGVPLGKVSVFAGESGSGKSFICSGNLARNAQQQGCQVILFDSENALDKEWLEALDVDTTPEKLLRFQVSMVDDVAKTMSDFIKSYKAEFSDLPYEEQPKMLFVIDSLGMLLTPTDVDQFQKGDMKGDLGRKAKSLTALVRNTVSQIAPHPIGVVATNHTYASQDMFDPDDKISGGCLTAGHKVWMADGSAKNIENIQVGDVVVTLDGDIEVSETFRFDDKEVFEIELETGEVVQATSEHKFLTQIGDNDLVWKTLDELSEGDEILQVE